MKIGVISDTHIPRAAKTIPPKVFKLFGSVELIVHAGDITDRYALEQLQSIAPVIAVHGNRDSHELKTSLPEERIVELCGFRIGILHGHGDMGTTLDRLPTFFKGVELDCILFGHSHIPFNRLINGTLYLNPGSPTIKKRQPMYSVGILILEDTLKAKIEYFDTCQVNPESE